MMNIRFNQLTVGLLYLLTLGEVSSLHAQDRYFVLIFGSQSKLNNPTRSHTWATVVKANAEGTRLEEITISWLPASEQVRLLTVRGEPGVNLGLHATMSRYQQLNGNVSLWGPYELINERGPILFARAQWQSARLNHGNVLYKALDPNIGPRAAYITDCIHAITDLDEEHGRTAYTELLRFGNRASEYIVREFNRHGRIDRRQRHEWLIDALGLRQYALTERR